MLGRWGATALVAFVVLCSPAGGAEGGEAEEGPASLPTLGATLEGMRARYGAQVAALQAYLLHYAIRGGSVLDASASIAGIETRNELEYVVFELDTGIVYHEESVPPPLRLARIWSDVVEPSVRRAAQMGFPAGGIGLRILYRTGSYSDRAEIQRQLRAQRITSTKASFYVSMSDAVQLIAEQIESQELADRSQVLIGGQPARVDLGLIPRRAAETGP